MNSSSSRWCVWVGFVCVDNSVCLHQASITWASFMRTACCGSPWIRSQTDSYSSLVWDNTLTRWSWVSRSSAGSTLDSLSVCLFVFSINNVCFSTNKIFARCFQGILHPRRENWDGSEPEEAVPRWRKVHRWVNEINEGMNWLKYLQQNTKIWWMKRKDVRSSTGHCPRDDGFFVHVSSPDHELYSTWFDLVTWQYYSD